MVARSAERRVSPPFLNLLYDLPQPMATIEDFCRAVHDDLPTLSDLELARELSRVWRRLTVEWPPLDHWLWSRRAACFAERDRRRAGRQQP